MPTAISLKNTACLVRTAVCAEVVREAQGLVLDDFFALSVQDLTDLSEPRCLLRLHAAKLRWTLLPLPGPTAWCLWGRPSRSAQH